MATYSPQVKQEDENMPHKPCQNSSNLDNSHDDWEQRTPLELEDDRWDVFLPDGDQDPFPEPSDFWIEVDRRHDLLGNCLAIC